MKRLARPLPPGSCSLILTFAADLDNVSLQLAEQGTVSNLDMQLSKLTQPRVFPCVLNGLPSTRQLQYLFWRQASDCM